MGGLISYDDDNEAWFDNPSLVLVNPRRSARPRSRFTGRFLPAKSGWKVPEDFSFSRSHGRRKKRSKRMAARARNRRGQFTKRSRTRHGRKHAAPRRRRRHTAATNPRPRRRRRHYAANRSHRRRTHRVRHYKHNPRRRHYRRNPDAGGAGETHIGGIAIPSVETIGFTVAGVVVSPMISAQIQALAPSFFTGNQYAPWIADLAAVIVPGILIRKFVNKRAGTLYMVGGSVNLAIKAIKQFAPSLATTLNLSGQPMVGSYFNRPGNVRAFPQPRLATPLSALIGEAPERLNPSGRF